MNLIAAADSTFGIGKDGTLAWHISGDLKYFKEKTAQKTVIMGRKTLESLPGGKPLKDRQNVIFTSQKGDFGENSVCVSSTDELFSLDVDFENAFVIGGESIYNLLYPYCKKAYITKVDGDFSCDRFLMDFDENPLWRMTESGEKITEGENSYSFCVYENSNPLPIKKSEYIGDKKCVCVWNTGSEFDADIKISLLKSCGIDAYKKYPGFSSAAKVYYGTTNLGVMIYVMSDKAAEAIEILSAPFDENDIFDGENE